MVFNTDIDLAQAIVQDRLQRAEQRRLVQNCAQKQDAKLEKLTERIGTILIAVGRRLQGARALDTSTTQPPALGHS